MKTTIPVSEGSGVYLTPDMVDACVLKIDCAIEALGLSQRRLSGVDALHQNLRQAEDALGDAEAAVDEALFLRDEAAAALAAFTEGGQG